MNETAVSYHPATDPAIKAADDRDSAVDTRYLELSGLLEGVKLRRDERINNGQAYEVSPMEMGLIERVASKMNTREVGLLIMMRLFRDGSFSVLEDVCLRLARVDVEAPKMGDNLDE